MLLKIDNITVQYGKATALHGVSMEVAEGSVVSLVGANGAGKTTLVEGIIRVNTFSLRRNMV